MTDSQGKTIVVGARAVIIDGGKFNGRIGDVRGISETCPPNRGGSNRPRVRIADGNPQDPDWSAWVRPSQITIVDAGE